MEGLVINNQFWKNKKVLLTGHTGFKGSWLSLWLQKLGADLVGFSKNIPTKPSLFELANVDEGMISITGDICDYNQIKNVMNKHKPEIIIHMAAQSLVHESYKNPLETFATNVMGTVNLFETIRKQNNVCVVVNVTSDKCYDNKGPMRVHKEDDSMGGFDPYSSSKGCAELVTSSFRDSFFNPEKYHEHKISLASVRAGNVIGGGDWAQDRLIPDIVRNVIQETRLKIRNPSSIRPWQYVLEPLHGYLLLAEKLWMDGPRYSQAWNFGPDEQNKRPVSWIVNKFYELWGKQFIWDLDNSHPPESNYLQLDSTKAKQNLGWHPKTNLDLALKWTVDWYKQYKNNNDMRRFTETQINNFTLL